MQILPAKGSVSLFSLEAATCTSTVNNEGISDGTDREPVQITPFKTNPKPSAQRTSFILAWTGCFTAGIKQVFSSSKERCEARFHIAGQSNIAALAAIKYSLSSVKWKLLLIYYRTKNCVVCTAFPKLLGKLELLRTNLCHHKSMMSQLSSLVKAFSGLFGKLSW